MNVDKIKMGIAYTLVFAYALIMAGKVFDEELNLNLPMYHKWLESAPVHGEIYDNRSAESDNTPSSLEDTVIAPEN